MKLQAEALVDQYGNVHLPYDQVTPTPGLQLSLVSQHRPLANAHIKPFLADYTRVRALHIINGMGVALGDSIIGLSVLAWLKQRWPQLHITLYQSPHLAAHVREIYRHASFIDALVALPIALAKLPPADAADTLVIDLADFLYRPAFNAMPMVDFFLHSLGLQAAQMPVEAKANTWLQQIATPALPSQLAQPYILIAANASTALRSMPLPVLTELAHRVQRQTGLVVAGFGPLALTGWIDLAPWSRQLPQFMAATAGATRLISVDSASIHIAAGLNTPCDALFMGMPTEWRTRDYPLCQAVQLDYQNALSGRHHAETQQDLTAAEDAWAHWLEGPASYR